MSDGGFDVDELIRKRRRSMNLFGIVTDKITGNRVSYPYISNDNEEYVAKSDNSNNQAQTKSVPAKSIGQQTVQVALHRHVLAIARYDLQSAPVPSDLDKKSKSTM